jgi:hypothetical protein
MGHQLDNASVCVEQLKVERLNNTEKRRAPTVTAPQNKKTGF